MFVCVHNRKSNRERERDSYISIYLYNIYIYIERERETKRKRDEKIDDDADDVIRYQPSTFKHKAQWNRIVVQERH